MSKKLIKLTQELIRCQSLSGNEKNISRICVAEIKKALFDEIFTDKYGSVIGIIKGKKGGPNILFDAHIDHVPAPNPEKWQFKPFSGQIENKKIYGRGATDMKGAVAAIIQAGSEIARIKKEIHGNYIVSLTTWEEFFEGFTLSNVIKELSKKRFKPDYVVITEATNLAIAIGQRGRAEIVLESFGRPAHSGHAESGINAVIQLLPVMNDIEKIAPPHDELLGYGSCVLTDIKSSPYPGASVVPDYCRVTCDRRLLVGESEASVLAPINKIIEKHKASIKGKISTKINQSELTYYKNKKKMSKNITQFPPAWKIDPSSILVKKAKEAVASTGISPILSHYSFCTNGSYSAGIMKIPTIGIGPSRENLAHTVNEYVEIDQLIMAKEIYVALAKSILS